MSRAAHSQHRGRHVSVVLGLCALLSGCSILQWQARDQTLFVVNVGCNAVDYAQTTWAIDNGYSENNPLLGDHPSDDQVATLKLAETAIVSWAADNAKSHRTAVLAAMTLPCVLAVVHNYNEGARP